MAFLRQKRNRSLSPWGNSKWGNSDTGNKKPPCVKFPCVGRPCVKHPGLWYSLLFTLPFLLLFSVQVGFCSEIDVDRDRDVDISMGTFNYFFNSSDRAFEEAQGRSLPEIQTGFYFGAYMSVKSGLFTFFFNTKNVYSMYEAGVALNMIGNENSFALSIPLTFDLAYRIPLAKRFALFPFAGTGINFVRTEEEDRYNWQLYYLLELGSELKYFLWRDTYLKIRITYALMFVDNLESGYMHVLKVRFPVPFIP